MSQGSQITHYYLMSMKDSCDRILKYADGVSYEKFSSDYLLIDAIERNFLVLGEASKKVPYRFKKKFDKIPWESMYRLRNRIAHEFFDVDPEMLWAIIQNDLKDNLNDLVLLIHQNQSVSNIRRKKF